MREVPGRAANLPDALVGQAPLLLEVLQQHLLKIPALVGRLQQELAADVQGIEHFTKNVDLQLAVSAVADAHRLGALIAREPGKLDLGEAPLAGEPTIGRAEERRVGKECVGTCRSRWSQYH